MPFRPFVKTGIVLLLLLAGKANAQLSANFTASTTGGCTPLAVTFNNTTTGNSPSTQYVWTFGNGNGVDTAFFMPSVSAIYSTPQTYTVTLTAIDGTQVSSKTETIIVYPNPVVSFTATNNTGCLPLNTSFTSTSTTSSGTITNYFWDFGDGNTENTTTPSAVNTYDFAQTYSPGLTVTNSYGCTANVTMPNLVNVYPPVTAGFTSDSVTLCDPTTPVQFNNTSTGPGTLTYSWNFGDGTTSTAANPIHAYTSQGIYTVSLTAISSDGCTSTTTKSEYINADDFNLAFTIPAVTCSNAPALFTDGSTPPPSGTPQWTFSDGGTAAGASVTHDFTAPGNYTVTLTDKYGACTVNLTKTVTVKTGVNLSGFQLTLDSVCGAPALVSFTDTSAAAVSWHWNFTGNPADTSSKQDPAFLYTTNGTFAPTLTVTDANGCQGTISEPVNITPPSAVITAAETLTPSDSVCSIINATFTATSPDTLVQYLWNFGDSTTSTSPDPTHTYSKPGTYDITLTYVTNHGCQGVSNTIPIVVYPKPKAAFMAMDTLICGNTAVDFVNQSTGNATVYTWNYGNGVTLVNDGNPAYYSYGDSGTYTVTLIASNPGCADTAVRVNYIRVLPPFPNIKTLNTCDSTRGTVTLVDSATLATTSTWSFGDGSAPVSFTTSSDTTYHTYTKSGAYQVILTCTNGSCTLSDTTEVYVLLKQQPQLSSAVTAICASSQLPVLVNSLDTNYESVANGSTNYYNINQWQYGDSSTFNGNQNSLTVQYSGKVNGLTTGKDSLRVILQSAYFGCYDTSNYIPLKVNGPIPAFGVQGGALCYKFPVTFTDSTKDSVPIVKWVWSFGDAATTARTNGDTVIHIYGAPGSYTPMLTVTDSLGCTATTSNYYSTVTMNGPQANFTWTPTSITPGTTATFTNTSTGTSGSTIYQWYFQSDGSTSTNPISVTHTYPNITLDSVRLIANGGAIGTCSDTIIKPVPVETLNANFTYTTQYINATNCPPMVVNFISTTFDADSLVWNFGDGATADNNPKPIHTYKLPGLYLVTLTAYGPNGTNIVIEDSITVKGPVASVRANILQGCIPDSVTLTATTNYASAYTWDFGDGTVINSNDTIQTHTYILPGVYTPALILTDSTGCQASFSPKQTIFMDTLHVRLRPSLSFCDSAQLLFVPDILSFAVDSLHQPLTYHWSFGTGNPADTANTPTTSFDFNNPGAYPVTIQVASIPGCTASASDTMVIRASARPSIQGPAVACAGDSLLYTATASVVGGLPDTAHVVYQWNFGNQDTSSAVQPPKQAYKPGQDTIQLVMEYNGCYDTAAVPLTVYPYPVLDLTPHKKTICDGDSVQLSVNPGPIYTWTPSVGLTSDTSSSPKAGPALPVTYYVTGVSNGCSATDSAVIGVILRVQLKIPADTFVCIGNSVELSAYGADLYQWSPTEFLSDISGGHALATPGVTTTYTVVGQDSLHCFADTNRIVVEVDSLPTISLPPVVVTPAGVGVTLTPIVSSDVTAYRWSPPTGLSCTDCADPVAIPADPTTYTVIVSTDHGCFASASVSFSLTCREDAVSVPSAFTPNHDGHNDIFYPLGKGIKTINNFEVFDRWGRPVYSRQNIPINAESYGWDGTTNGREMPPDAYVYILELTCETGERFMLKGTVVLIR